MPDKMFHKTNGNPPGPSGQPDELWGLAKASGVSRRRFLTLMAAGGAAAVIAACAGEAAPTTPSAPSAGEAVPVARVPLPPPDAKMVTTACDYCVVGCGYKVYPPGRWGPQAAQPPVRTPCRSISPWPSKRATGCLPTCTTSSRSPAPPTTCWCCPTGRPRW